MNFKTKFGKFAVVAGLGLSLIAAGCGNEETGSEVNEEPTDTGNTDNAASEEVEVQGFEHITGIDAGAGVMSATEEAIAEYELDIELMPSSGAAMTAALHSAIENEEWIVVTGWTPHWKFAAYDLKYLEDPKGVFGGSENIHTIVRKGLENDKPEAYAVLDNFYWTSDNMGEVMVDIAQNETAPVDAAQKWIDNNRDIVESWTEGVATVDGEPLHLVYVEWDSEIASTNVIALVLEELGYDVEMTPLGAGHMWNGVVSGEADAMVAAWLPGTHGHYYEDNEENFIDLGANLEGAKVGLVVPTYVDIDSIEEIVAE